jgi:hypothetical protein
VLLVLVYRDLDGDLHGMTAWPATGLALHASARCGNGGRDRKRLEAFLLAGTRPVTSSREWDRTQDHRGR